MLGGEHLIILALIFLLGLVILIAFGYRFFADWRQRIIRLEKKNGHEQHQIDEIKQKLAISEQTIKELKQEIKQLQKAYNASQEKLKKYERK